MVSREINIMTRVVDNRLKIDWKITVLSITSTLLITIDYYHPLLDWQKLVPGLILAGTFNNAIDRTILYFIVPILVVFLVFRQSPSEFGFGFGNWRVGIALTLAGIVIMIPILWWLGHGGDPAMQAYYRTRTTGVPWSTFLDLFGWEYLFRGWLLFGYARKFGPEAIWLQAVPFALAHLGKPELETLSTIFGGFAFGWVAWKTRSFIYPFLIHWFVATFIILVAAGRIG
jgi:uncharacterized protein